MVMVLVCPSEGRESTQPGPERLRAHAAYKENSGLGPRRSRGQLRPQDRSSSLLTGATLHSTSAGSRGLPTRCDASDLGWARLTRSAAAWIAAGSTGGLGAGSAALAIGRLTTRRQVALTRVGDASRDVPHDVVIEGPQRDLPQLKSLLHEIPSFVQERV
jgi:hypothetical protein